MHLRDLPYILSPLDDIVIELIPPRQRCELRAWELGERADVETVCGEDYAIEHAGDACGRDELLVGQ